MILVVGSEVCGTIDVNCLLKAAAILVWLDSGVLLKVMGWLGVCGGLFPERDLRRDQKYVVLCLCEQLSTFCVHVSRFDFSISCVICWSRELMRVLVGSVERSKSRSRINCLALSDRLGMKLGI